MPDTTATIDNVYEAWNRHDATAIAASFAAGGVYADPLTRVDLSGDNLTNHVQSLLEVIRDLRICVSRTIAEGDVEAHGEGDLTFGHSMRSWVSKAKPGALGMTGLLARDERRCWDVKTAGSPAFGYSRAASHRDYLTGAATAVRDTRSARDLQLHGL
jgi:hypothetical protein